jgi:SAM-dependent methyltransferase
MISSRTDTSNGSGTASAEEIAYSTARRHDGRGAAGHGRGGIMLSEGESRAFGAFERRGWDKAAIRYHQHFGTLTRQSCEALLDAACVQAGSKALDVATGPGYVAAAACQRGADAIGLDFSPTQIELARATYPGVEFQQGGAENLPFQADCFDAVVMGFCLLHLPNAERAIAEAFRVLKPGGYFAATVWATPEPDSAFGIMLGAIERHGAMVDLPAGPPFFRFADAEEARRVLVAAGFVAPRTRLVPQYWRHASADDLFAAFNEGSVRAAAVLRAQPEQTRQKIKLAVREQVLKLALDGGAYVICAPATLLSARKPLP